MDVTGRSTRGARFALRLKVLLAAYALAVAVLPISHHDLACHLKSTTHCATCIVGASAESSPDAEGPDRFRLDDAGAAALGDSSPGESPISGLLPGRAPPASA